MKTNRTIVFALFAATASWQGLLAQTANPTPPATPLQDEPVLELSPSEVKADEDTGYQATQTLAGTRGTYAGLGAAGVHPDKSQPILIALSVNGGEGFIGMIGVTFRAAAESIRVRRPVQRRCTSRIQ